MRHDPPSRRVLWELHPAYLFAVKIRIAVMEFIEQPIVLGHSSIDHHKVRIEDCTDRQILLQ